MDTTLAEADTTALIRAGETCERPIRFSRDDIAAFARLTGDTNPLHHDQRAARAARHGDIIASGQQTTAVMIGTLASHFSRSDDGLARELLCLNFNFAFKAPVFAGQEMLLRWRVSTVEWSASLGGWLAHVDGWALVGEQPSVIGRGTLLVKGGEG